MEHLQSGTTIAIDTLLSTTSNTSYHSGQTEEIMKEYLFYDEDLGDISVSPEAVSISEIVAIEETEEELAALDSTSKSASISPSRPATSHSEALSCLDTLIPYLETLPYSSLQHPTSQQSLNISDTVGYLQILSTAIKTHQYVHCKQQTLSS